MYKIIITEIDEQGNEKPFMNGALDNERYEGFLFMGEADDGVRSVGADMSTMGVVNGLVGTTNINDCVVTAAGIIVSGGGSANAPS